MKHLLAALPILLSMSMLAHGQQSSKPNFSGAWIFDAQKSTLQDPAPSSMTLQIEQHDPHIRLSRTQVYGGKSDLWTLDTATDGQKEVVQHSALYTSHIRMYWDGDTLVLDEKITAGDGSKATNTVKYALGADGTSLVAVENEETPVGKTTNKWVYDKQSH
ncbi:MAG: hypothetical protein WCC87_01190 [Candidatus Korobacteraceae bacterium]